MNKLGSEFLKEVKDYERSIIGGFTFRHIVMLTGVVLATILAAGIILLGLPDILHYIILPIILIPFMIFGLKQEERLKDMLTFRLPIQERAYQTEFESEEPYGKFTISQEKGVNEFDPIPTGEGEASQTNNEALNTKYN